MEHNLCYGTMLEMTSNMGRRKCTYALSYAFHLKNVLLHSVIKLTPREGKHGEELNLSFIHESSCKVYLPIEGHLAGQFDSKAQVGAFLGMAEKRDIPCWY